jgi:hypothetical protein
MLNKLIEMLFPFTDNPSDFRLKNEPTWYSNRFRYILYSGNGGKTYKKVYKARSPLFSDGDSILKYDWEFEPIDFNAEKTSFGEYKEKFKSIKDIRDYESKEYQRYLDGREDTKKSRTEYIKILNKNIS